MAIKKVLAAVGLVCVVTPAALAAMSQKDYRYTRLAEVKQVLQNLLGLYSLLDGDIGKGRILERNGPGLGHGKLPFRATDSLVPEIAKLGTFYLAFPNGDPFATVAIDDTVLAEAAAVTPGASDGAAAEDAGNRFHGNSSSTRGANGGTGASGLPGGGGGGGGGGAGDGQSVEMTLAEIDAQNGATAGDPSVMPVPSSVWMLLGALAGLGVLGYRRGTT